ncbi:hypothetical protein HZB07_03980 [Candidatus Saganbacteria bacterium]|nr:hypothetical protein [Candidatus Saganbacteria bacterium]
MPKLLELLNKNRLTLIVDVPEAKAELAEAAIAGGADALQLKVAGEFSEQKESLTRILEASKIPVGLMFEGKTIPEEEKVNEYLKLGFDFVNFRRDHLPAYYAQLTGVAKVMTLDNAFTMDLVLGVDENGVEALAAAIIPPGGQGKHLVVGDLQNYISVVLAAGVPAIIPTQLCIKPSEVAILADTEAKGLLLTTVILGITAKHIEQNTREFRLAIDER